MKKQTKSGLLEALFNQPWDTPEKEPPEAEAPRKKRPWASDRVECRHCGSLAPVNRACPGCGLLPEERKP